MGLIPQTDIGTDTSTIAPHLDFLTDVIQASDNSIAYKSELRELRIANCGKYGYRPNAETGEGIFHPQWCNYFRECSKCAIRRKKRFRRSIGVAMHRHNTVCMTWANSDDAAKSICDGISKEDYKRFPMQDGSVFVFWRGVYGDANKIHDARELDALDWAAIVDTPEGRRMSGALGKDDPEDEEEILGTVYLNKVTTNAPLDLEREVEKQAREQTADMDPHTIEEVENACAERTNVYLALLTELGYEELYSTMISQKIKSINWLNRYDIKKHFARVDRPLTFWVEPELILQH